MWLSPIRVVLNAAAFHMMSEMITDMVTRRPLLMEHVIACTSYHQDDLISPGTANVFFRTSP